MAIVWIPNYVIAVSNGLCNCVWVIRVLIGRFCLYWQIFSELSYWILLFYKVISWLILLYFQGIKLSHFQIMIILPFPFILTISILFYLYWLKPVEQTWRVVKIDFLSYFWFTVNNVFLLSMALAYRVRIY